MNGIPPSVGILEGVVLGFCKFHSYSSGSLIDCAFGCGGGPEGAWNARVMAILFNDGEKSFGLPLNLGSLRMETQDDALRQQPAMIEHEADSFSEEWVVDSNSESFVGRWQSLVSQTNWEKGKIISEWRQSKIDDGAASSQYSDEAWASMVGFVTCQHVGRLRRVYDRFGESWSTYAGLYWSHFWAALDWDDAELWLEGASQSRWSISQMRRTRAQAMQTADSTYQVETARIAEATDDGFRTSSNGLDGTSGNEVESSSTGRPLSRAFVDGGDAKDDQQDEYSSGTKDKFESGPRNERPDFGDTLDANEDFGDTAQRSRNSDAMSDGSERIEVADSGLSQESPRGNPFESLGNLPQDVQELVEQFKLCIIRHRSSQWQEISRSELLAALDALRAFC